jgi:Protein of unknown function (DUF1236)
MTNRLMISVAAAALIAGTGFANAQGTGMSRDTPSAAPAQQGAPSSDRGASDRGTSAGGEMNRDAAKPEMKSTQSEQQSPAAGKNQRADEKTMPGQNKSSQNDNAQKKSMSSENDNNAKTGKDMKAEGGQDRNGMKAEGSEDRNGKMNADSKGGAEGKTVGQAGAGAKLSGDQRTKITTVIRGQHVQPVTNVNFSISVGTRVPRDVSFHPLPAEIVTIYPDWRGYEFVLVRDQILVIDPQSFEIVAVLDA